MDFKQSLQFAQQNPDSPLTTEFINRVQSGKMNNEITAAGLDPSKFVRQAPNVAQIQEKPSIFEGLKANAPLLSPAIDEIQTGVERIKQAKTIPEKVIAGGETLAAAPMAELSKAFEFTGIPWLAGKAQQISEPLEKGLASLATSVIPDSIKQGFKNFLTSPEITNIANKLDKTDPQAWKDFNNAIGYLAMGLGGKKAPEIAGEIKSGIETAKTAVKTGMEKVSPTPTIPETVGKITQAEPTEIPIAQRALGKIDTTGVQTYADLSNKLDSTIKSNLKSVDEAYAKDPKSYSTNELTQRTPSGKYGINYPKQAISDLKDLYTETKDIVNKERITNLQNKLNSEGLTADEVNKLSREYGSKFNAFKANNQIKSGKVAAGAENVRTGLKETARGLLKDPTVAELDKSTSDMIKTKEMSDEMAKKVQVLENKLNKSGLIQKAGGMIAKVFDLATGGFVKGFIKTLTGIGAKEGEILNPIELQNNLSKNLKMLDKLNSMKPEDAIKEINSLPKAEGEIPKTMDLMEEAKKYKSAEEFVKNQQPVYHGSETPLKNFSDKKGGVFFTDSMEDASGYAGNLDNVYEGYLNFKNPLVIDAKGAKWDKLNTKWGKSTQEIISNAQKDGYDGVTFKNIVDNVMDTAGMGESTVHYAYKPTSSFLNESQLTDIWNKANKK